jgi:Arc/MetJ-type ribon-helix-helix transcriptional regulator
MNRYDNISYLLGVSMAKEKIAITIDEQFLTELDRLVAERVFQNRSQAIQLALSEKLQKMKKNRLIRECSKLNPEEEKAMAEEGIGKDSEWPE